jgi:hypothetical protein
MPRYTSSTSTSYSSNAGAQKGSGPLTLGLQIKAAPGSGSDVDVGLSARAKASGKKSDFSLSTKSKSGKVDKLKVDVGVGDWAGRPGDRDDIDFLILLSGSKGGSKLPAKPIKSLKGIDLLLDIELKGLPLSAAFRPGTVEDLKLVKFVAPNGETSWGYRGTIDADSHRVKLDLTSGSGAKVAELALNLHAPDDHGPDGG